MTSSRTGWRRAKTMGWDDQTRGLTSSRTTELETGKDKGWDDQARGSALKQLVHVRSEDRQRQWGEMIRQEACAQLTSSRTRWRRVKTMGWNDQTRGLHSGDKFTYSLDG